MKGSIKVLQEGDNRPMTLDQSTFVAQGGEGSVHRVGSNIFKVYHEAAKMIDPRKVKELAALASCPAIMAPSKVLTDMGGVPIGFTMGWAGDTVALSKVFSNSWRNRTGYTAKMAWALVERMIDTTRFIHGKGCLAVDLNEFNFLVRNSDRTAPVFIDVDSYKTPNFPPTAIMDSIKDWNAKEFSELTDWYSLGIIATQVLIGIHPFRGRHPQYGKGDMVKRMRDGVSIFNPETRLKASVRDMSLIPDDFRKWLVSMFEDGKRLPPPMIQAAVFVAVVREAVKGSGIFNIRKYRQFSEPVMRFEKPNGIDFAIMSSGAEYGNKRLDSTVCGIVSNTAGGTYAVSVRGNGFLYVENIQTGLSFMTHLRVSDMMAQNNRVYVRHEGQLSELDIIEMGGNIHVVAQNHWNVLPNSSNLYSGVLVQEVFGDKWLYVPYGQNKMATLKVDELKDYKIVDARQERNVCVVIGAKAGRYDRITIVFEENRKGDIGYAPKYKTTVDSDIGSTLGINFTVLTNGIVAMFNENDELVLFSKKKPEACKAISDNSINSSMQLCSHGTQVMFWDGDTVYELSMCN